MYSDDENKDKYEDQDDHNKSKNKDTIPQKTYTDRELDQMSFSEREQGEWNDHGYGLLNYRLQSIYDLKQNLDKIQNPETKKIIVEIEPAEIIRQFYENRNKNKQQDDSASKSFDIETGSGSESESEIESINPKEDTNTKKENKKTLKF